MIRLLSFIIQCLVEFDLQCIGDIIDLKVLTISSLVNMTDMKLVHRFSIAWIRDLKRNRNIFRAYQND